MRTSLRGRRSHQAGACRAVLVQGRPHVPHRPARRALLLLAAEAEPAALAQARAAIGRCLAARDVARGAVDERRRVDAPPASQPPFDELELARRVALRLGARVAAPAALARAAAERRLAPAVVRAVGRAHLLHARRSRVTAVAKAHAVEAGAAPQAALGTVAQPTVGARPARLAHARAAAALASAAAAERAGDLSAVEARVALVTHADTIVTHAIARAVAVAGAWGGHVVRPSLEEVGTNRVRAWTWRRR